MPFIASGAALAQSVSYLGCNNQAIVLPDKPDLLPSETLIPLCDLSIKKEVSINGGTFVDANTSSVAASAYIGDQVTWKITVKNTSTRGAVPTSIVTVGDVLPAGFTLLSSTTSNTPSDFTANTWKINPTSDLPATLNIVGTAITAGTFKNTAAFTTFDSCNDGCNSTYNDAVPSNNSDDAYVTILAKPQVLGASTTTITPTLVNTGTSTLVSALAAALLAVTAGVIIFARRSSDK